MLLGMDEYPYHQIADTFAAVAGSDPQWNDGHYVCVADVTGAVLLTSNVRLYQNNDVLDGFVCLRHAGRQHNIRVSRRLRPDIETLGAGPLRLEILEPLQAVRLVLDPGDHGFALDITCHSLGVPHHAPVEVLRVDGRLLHERVTYELAGRCTGWVTVGDTRVELTSATSAFFRNHSWGNQGGRGGPRYGAPRTPRRRTGVRQWVLFAMETHSGFWSQDPGRPARGALLHPDGAVPVVDVEHELRFHPGGRRLAGGAFTLVQPGGTRRSYTFEDLGWVYCQGGGYFGGFDDGLGQGVYRGEQHLEGEVWDVRHPTTIVRPDGTSFEVADDWAESFTVLRSEGEAGLAHHECVVFRPAEPGASPGPG